MDLSKQRVERRIGIAMLVVEVIAVMLILVAYEDGPWYYWIAVYAIAEPVLLVFTLVFCYLFNVETSPYE